MKRRQYRINLKLHKESNGNSEFATLGCKFDSAQTGSFRDKSEVPALVGRSTVPASWHQSVYDLVHQKEAIRLAMKW